MKHNTETIVTSVPVIITKTHTTVRHKTKTEEEKFTKTKVSFAVRIPAIEALTDVFRLFSARKPSSSRLIRPILFHLLGRRRTPLPVLLLFIQSPRL